MSGGWIQASLVRSLAGTNGLPAWRWIFIIVSVITIPTALFGNFFHYSKEYLLITVVGWFVIPGLPSHRAAWYLNDEEKEHAATRLGQAQKYDWDRTVFKRVLLSWQFWLLPTIFMCESSPWKVPF
jgi:ACS family pantothenate transporter-like MFS transporter